MNRKANGATIRALRKALGISQVSLAARVGITKVYLCQIELGTKDKRPSPEVLRGIADALGVTIESISYPVPEPEVAAS
jgi:transcriptional regulator with XRE-family HTH domain